MKPCAQPLMPGGVLRRGVRKAWAVVGPKMVTPFDCPSPSSISMYFAMSPAVDDPAPAGAICSMNS